MLTSAQAQQELTTSSNPPSQSVSGEQSGQTLRIRVITPESAQSGSSIDTIAPLPTALPISATLRQLKGLVQEQLGFPTDDGACPELECNCSFARQIDQNAAFNTRSLKNHDPLRTAIVVHSNNQVATIPVERLTLNTIKLAAGSHFQERMTNKVLKVVGGVQINDQRNAQDTQYIKAPVLAICSKHCLAQGQTWKQEDSQRDLIVDVHTSECPIEITAHNVDTTISASALEDCAVNGILNIFAVQRWTLGHTEAVAPGKAGIFKKSEAWDHVISQSDRGMASLLSTLRVFSDLASGSKMEDERQDAVLHMIHLLTRFPPAVRAAYILMRGETPRLSERAALAQCLYEVLKKVVPSQTVRSDPKRLFEGSRLLFGLIFEKGKNMKLSKPDDVSRLPYVGMRIYDLRNLTTMSPVLALPVQTTLGLVDTGFYRAFDEDGPLRWTNGNVMQKASTLVQVLSRVATLAGGTKKQVVVYNVDAVRSSSRYLDGGDISKIISPAEYNDLTFLANLCSRNQLSVTPPAKLASAIAPLLTLDRNGHLAVYVGRASCAEAGRDILMFRPTSVGEEETVDVSIITQLLEPILIERTADGTVVFEAYGDVYRKLAAPDELTMICIDLSSSMGDRCGFSDIQGTEDADAEVQRSALSSAGAPLAMMENPAFALPDPDELKGACADYMAVALLLTVHRIPEDSRVV